MSKRQVNIVVALLCIDMGLAIGWMMYGVALVRFAAGG